METKFVPCLKKSVTGDEWSQMYNDYPNTDDAVVERFGFRWNMFSVCINPNTIEIKANGCTVIVIKTAQTDVNEWVWGVFCCGVCDTSSPVWFGGDKYPSEHKAIVAALLYLRGRKYHRAIKNAIETAINERCFVQQTLF